MASLSWNHHRHLELYAAVPLAGAVLQTLNLCLSAEEMAYIAGHADDRLIIADPDRPARRRAPRARRPRLRRRLRGAGRGRSGADRTTAPLGARPRRALLHLGHDRYHDVVQRAMHLHGALGISNEMPFSAMMVDAQVMATADKVHRQTLARQVLRDAVPGEPLFGSGHLPTRTEAARRHLAARLEHEVAAL